MTTAMSQAADTTSPIPSAPPRGRRRTPPLWPVVCVQAAGAVLLAGMAAGDGWPAVTVPLAGLLVVVGLLRRRGQPLLRWLLLARALRRRQRSARGPLPAAVDPLLALASECRPGVKVFPFRDGRQRETGMVEDHATLSVVLRVSAAHTPLQPGRDERPLPLSLLQEALQQHDVALASVRCVQHTLPAPAAALPQRSVAAASYGPLTAPTGTPGLRLTWVVLRFDPERCPAAVAARGGGTDGARRCLARAAEQLASRLTGAGFTAATLTETELLAGVAAAASADPHTTALVGRGNGPRPRRTVEKPRSWRCDDRWHSTFRVTAWPERLPLATALASLTAIPALATTVSLALRPAGRGTVAIRGRVRVTAGSQRELRLLRRGIQRAARRGQFGIALMDHEQLLGARATLPLGGAG